MWNTDFKKKKIPPKFHTFYSIFWLSFSLCHITKNPVHVLHFHYISSGRLPFYSFKQQLSYSVHLFYLGMYIIHIFVVYSCSRYIILHQSSCSLESSNHICGLSREDTTLTWKQTYRENNPVYFSMHLFTFPVSLWMAGAVWSLIGFSLFHVRQMKAFNVGAKGSIWIITRAPSCEHKLLHTATDVWHTHTH